MVAAHQFIRSIVGEGDSSLPENIAPVEAQTALRDVMAEIAHLKAQTSALETLAKSWAIDIQDQFGTDYLVAGIQVKQMSRVQYDGKGALLFVQENGLHYTRPSLARAEFNKALRNGEVEFPHTITESTEAQIARDLSMYLEVE